MIRDYDDSIAYLERLVATPIRNDPGAGLERARLLLSWVGNPQQRFATLHVTGSSGKGSTSAMAASILRAAGYRVGIFSSPHLEHYTERIAVNSEPISAADWTRLLNRLYPFVEEMASGARPGYTLGRPALLQVLWPLAALYFVERGVDVAVVEVGMGGRYDSTNANNAAVSVITNVSLEHTRYLGATIAEIAHHKAGVAKPGGAVVTAAQDPQALHVIAAECAALGTALWHVAEIPSPSGSVGGEVAQPSFPSKRAGESEPLHPGSPSGEGVYYSGDESCLLVSTPSRDYHDLRLGLIGRHQRANAACAIAAVDALGALGIAHADENAVRRGVTEAYLPGRLERVAADPLTILDGAHNPDAAHTLSVALRDLFPHQRIVLLLGILGDKDIPAMVDALAPLAQCIVVTEPPWEGRMGKGSDVAAVAQRHLQDVTLIPAVPVALAEAQQRARALQAPLVVAGSLILVGAVRPTFTT